MIRLLSAFFVVLMATAPAAFAQQRTVASRVTLSTQPSRVRAVFPLPKVKPAELCQTGNWTKKPLDAEEEQNYLQIQTMGDKITVFVPRWTNGIVVEITNKAGGLKYLHRARVQTGALINIVIVTKDGVVQEFGPEKTKEEQEVDPKLYWQCLSKLPDDVKKRFQGYYGFGERFRIR